MHPQYTLHPWHILEDGFDPARQEISESIFSLGNGRFGLRGNFEESYSGKSLRGAYHAGVYYPDKTRVGWWKNGYPDYFAKVLNGVNWIGLDIQINGTPLDLATRTPSDFRRILDMQHGLLHRSFGLPTEDGGRLSFSFSRFCSMDDPDLGMIRLTISSHRFSGRIHLTPYLDFDVRNQDANYGEQFWERLGEAADNQSAMVSAQTKKTGFVVSSFMHVQASINGKSIAAGRPETLPMKARQPILLDVEDGDEIELFKYVINLSSLYVRPEEQTETGMQRVGSAAKTGFDKLLENHRAAWLRIWDNADISIDGNVEAQQGIRFNIFHLWQTYTGEDPRLNIGPKGFTGEKYGGSTYWDTEAYCLPFYLSCADPAIARNLLVYRHLQLGKAIENAEKLGFSAGAALYPMVTMNGEECHNEWEITFEEIHRNGAIVYAIYDYIRYTGDEAYMTEKGLDVLIAVARFWAQRVNWSAERQAFVMLGVTGPNEYENNVNNNWYTNYLAKWCLDYAGKSVARCQAEAPAAWTRIARQTTFAANEIHHWEEISRHLFLPYDDQRQVYLQQDGFLDKALMPAASLPKADRPLNQKWSWDRILRSCFIKQADVLQGFYFFEDHFDTDTLRRHFDFYEPMTVHESSLSPCVHAILASRLGLKEKAQEMYLRTARLDLDNYNHDTEDGLHITSMAGSWMSVVRGFAGMRVRNGRLELAPFLPAGWTGFQCKVRFRHRLLAIRITGDQCSVVRLEGDPLTILLHGHPLDV